MTDTLFNKILCLFCIHFGLPGPPLDAPAALKAPQERSQMRLPFGSPEPSKSFQMASGTVRAPQERSHTLLETLPELGRPAALKTRSKRVKSARRRSWRRSISASRAERSQTLLETLPELPFWPPEPSKSFQMASGTIWAPFPINLC